MKKMKRIGAILLIIFLVALYLSTLIFAIIDSPKTMGFFKASVAMTILVPVLLYAYSLFYRLTNKGNKDSSETNE